MSAAPDPLEAELSALRPRDASPGLRRRIAAGMARPRGRRRPRGIALAAALAALAAAGVLVGLAPWRKAPAPPESPVVVPAPPESDDAAPSLAAYRRALDRSPEALDRLLGRPAGRSVEVARIRFGTFPRSVATIDAVLGDD